MRMLFGGMGLVFFCMGSQALLTPEPLARLIGALFMLVGSFGIVFAAIELMARRAFSERTLTVRNSVPLGGTAEVVLCLTPRRALTLGKNSKMIVTTTERASYGAGTTTRDYTETLHREEFLLRLPTEFTERAEQVVLVKIPEDLPPTWRGNWNEFKTSVHVEIDVVKWPDLSLDTEIIVLPEVVA